MGSGGCPAITLNKNQSDESDRVRTKAMSRTGLRPVGYLVRRLGHSAPMKKRFICITLAIIILPVAVWFLLIDKSTHTAEMSERSFPNQYGLMVGHALLGWSSHKNSPSERNGYIYMRDVDPKGGNKPLWEFALTMKRRLADVVEADLRTEFYGMDDPRGGSAFGDAWADGAAILMPEGQVFFARLASDRSVIYAIRLAKQGGSKSGEATIRIQYILLPRQTSRALQRTAGPPLSWRVMELSSNHQRIGKD